MGSALKGREEESMQKGKTTGMQKGKETQWGCPVKVHVPKGLFESITSHIGFPLFLQPSVFPSVIVFSSDSTLFIM